jgi:hypothetical protein
MLNLAKPIKKDPDLLALKELERNMYHRKTSSGIKGYLLLIISCLGMIISGSDLYMALEPTKPDMFPEVEKKNKKEMTNWNTLSILLFQNETNGRKKIKIVIIQMANWIIHSVWPIFPKNLLNWTEWSKK